MKPRSQQTNETQCAKRVAILKFRFILYTSVEPIRAQFFLNHVTELLQKLDITIVAQQNTADLFVLRYELKQIREHGTGMRENRLSFVRSDNHVELFKEFFFNSFKHIKNIPIIEIERSAVYIDQIGQLTYRDILELFLLHQLNQSLTQQFLGSADTTIFFLFRSVFIFNIIHAVNSSFSEHIIDLCLFLAIYPSFA